MDLSETGSDEVCSFSISEVEGRRILNSMSSSMFRQMFFGKLSSFMYKGEWLEFYSPYHKGRRFIDLAVYATEVKAGTLRQATVSVSNIFKPIEQNSASNRSEGQKIDSLSSIRQSMSN